MRLRAWSLALWPLLLASIVAGEHAVGRAVGVALQLQARGPAGAPDRVPHHHRLSSPTATHPPSRTPLYLRDPGLLSHSPALTTASFGLCLLRLLLSCSALGSPHLPPGSLLLLLRETRPETCSRVRPQASNQPMGGKRQTAKQAKTNNLTDATKYSMQSARHSAPLLLSPVNICCSLAVYCAVVQMCICCCQGHLL